MFASLDLSVRCKWRAVRGVLQLARCALCECNIALPRGRDRLCGSWTSVQTLPRSGSAQGPQSCCSQMVLDAWSVDIIQAFGHLPPCSKQHMT